MAKKDIPKLSFTFTTENLKDFTLKIKELIKIDDKVVFKLTKENLLLYSAVTKGKQIYAFKSFVYKTSDILKLNDDLDNELTMILKDTKKLIQNLVSYLEFETDVNIELSYADINGIYYSDMMKTSNGKLKLSIPAGDPVGVNTTMTIDAIQKFSDTKNSQFSFEMDSKLFDKIKKLGVINASAKKSTNAADIDPLNLSVDNKKLMIGELRWSLEICDIDREDESYSFPKKYFNTLSLTDKAIVYVFDTFLLIRTEGSELLITMETSI